MGEIVSFGDSKDSLRKRIILLRECMPVNERERASYFIFDNFFKLPEYQTSEIIFAFAGFESEVSTLNSIFRMINEGKRVALPKVIDDKNMEFYEVRKETIRRWIPDLMSSFSREWPLTNGLTASGTAGDIMTDILLPRDMRDLCGRSPLLFPVR